MATNPRIAQAFAAVARERFAGVPHWHILAAGRWSLGPPAYILTPDNDPVVLNQRI